MISKELQNTLNFAYTEAKKRRHDYLTLEHLLYALLQDPAIIKIIHACGGPELQRDPATLSIVADALQQAMQ